MVILQRWNVGGEKLTLRELGVSTKGAAAVMND
jgi:hypothetical protein